MHEQMGAFMLLSPPANAAALLSPFQRPGKSRTARLAQSQSSQNNQDYGD